MKIQEALTKIRGLKTDAKVLFNEASTQKVRTLFLDVDAGYYKDNKEYDTNDKICSATDKLAEAHQLKLAVQEANVKHGLVYLIQKLDFLKTMCSHLKDFTNIPTTTDPQIISLGGLRAQIAYKVEQATFNTERIEYLYKFAQEEIRKINEELQQKNWEVEVDLSATDKTYITLGRGEE